MNSGSIKKRSCKGLQEGKLDNFRKEKKMKKAMLIMFALVLSVSLSFTMAFAGNGAPSGPHYNLNLLGKDNCPGGDMIDSSRHTIFVKLYFTDPDANNIVGDNPGNIAYLDKTNKIFLYPGTDFGVTDGNACNKGGAAFTLPANIATAWEVYVRELGKPGGNGDLRTCGIDEGPDGIKNTADDEVVCSSENVLLVRNTGKSTFRNVTQELTTMVIQVDVDGDGELETIRIPLFDPTLYQYFWDYDNNGLRLVQLRFYPVQQ
jgi:hypothetical protein